VSKSESNIFLSNARKVLFNFIQIICMNVALLRCTAGFSLAYGHSTFGFQLLAGVLRY
jgi:hypothetical protein